MSSWDAKEYSLCELNWSKDQHIRECLQELGAVERGEVGEDLIEGHRSGWQYNELCSRLHEGRLSVDNVVHTANKDAIFNNYNC